MDKTEQHVELTDRLHEISSREGRLSAALKANQIYIRDLNEEVKMLESVLMADRGFVIANLEEKLAILQGLEEQGAQLTVDYAHACAHRKEVQKEDRRLPE